MSMKSGIFGGIKVNSVKSNEIEEIAKTENVSQNLFFLCAFSVAFLLAVKVTATPNIKEKISAARLLFPLAPV